MGRGRNCIHPHTHTHHPSPITQKKVKTFLKSLFNFPLSPRPKISKKHLSNHTHTHNAQCTRALALSMRYPQSQTKPNQTNKHSYPNRKKIKHPKKTPLHHIHTYMFVVAPHHGDRRRRRVRVLGIHPNRPPTRPLCLLLCSPPR